MFRVYPYRKRAYVKPGMALAGTVKVKCVLALRQPHVGEDLLAGFKHAIAIEVDPGIEQTGRVVPVVAVTSMEADWPGTSDGEEADAVVYSVEFSQVEVRQNGMRGLSIIRLVIIIRIIGIIGRCGPVSTARTLPKSNVTFSPPAPTVTS